MNQQDTGNVTAIEHPVRGKMRSFVIEREMRLASTVGWRAAKQLRIALRTIKIDELSLEDSSVDECAVWLNNIGMAADYLKAACEVCDAAYTIMLNAITRPGAPLATVYEHLKEGALYRARP